MTDAADESQPDRRGRLLAAADESALGVLAADSVELACAVIDVLGRTEVPGELLDDLRGGSVFEQSPASRELLELIQPYLPEDEPDPGAEDDRTQVLGFAAAVIDLALDGGTEPGERAAEAAWTLADLHAHLDVTVPERFTAGAEPYDEFCLRRQNDLLELIAGGAGPDTAAVRDSTALGRSVLERAVRSLL